MVRGRARRGARVDPSVALFDVYPMEQVRWLSYWMYVMWGTLFGVIGAIALVLAAIGVYGVVFYTVSQRTRESVCALRSAPAARKSCGPCCGRWGCIALVGLAIGVAGAVSVTPVVGSLLIGMSPNDRRRSCGVSAPLVAVALAATWVPAWRASAVDPVIALRDP